MYERDDLNVVNIGTSARPFAQYTPAVVAPMRERRPEWWIAHRLLQELGHPSILDDDAARSVGEVAAHAASAASASTLADLQATGEVARPAAADAGRVLRQAGADRRRPRRLLPAVVRRRVRRAATSCSTSRAAADRDGAAADPRSRSVDAQLVVRQRAADEAAAAARPTRWRCTPTTPRRSGIADGDRVVVASAHGEVDADVALDDELMPGVVSMVHGWGHAASPRLRVAAEHPGTNPNVLLPSGPGSYEPLSQPGPHDRHPGHRRQGLIHPSVEGRKPRPPHAPMTVNTRMGRRRWRRTGWAGRGRGGRRGRCRSTGRSGP